MPASPTTVYGQHLNRILLGVFVFLALSSSPSARASDFWDEVRNPGLRAYRALVREAGSALRSGRFREALEKAERAAEAMSERAAAHVLRGLALGELKRDAEAVEAFEQALLLDGASLDDVEQGAAAASVAARAKVYPLAARILSRTLERMPDSPNRNKLYAFQADILQLLGPGELPAAVLAYRLALRDPAFGDETAVLMGLALALHREGKPDRAAELAVQAGARITVERILRSLPLPPPERSARLAILLESRGDLDGAERAWSVAAAAGPWSDHARRALEELNKKVPATAPKKGKGR